MGILHSESIIKLMVDFSDKRRRGFDKFPAYGHQGVEEKMIFFFFFFFYQFSDLEPFRSHLLFLQSEIRESFKVVKN